MGLAVVKSSRTYRCVGCGSLIKAWSEHFINRGTGERTHLNCDPNLGKKEVR